MIINHNQNHLNEADLNKNRDYDKSNLELMKKYIPAINHQKVKILFFVNVVGNITS